MNQTRNISPFGLRLQPELKSWLMEQADKEKRSLNSEITFRLERSMEKQEKACHE